MVFDARFDIEIIRATCDERQHVAAFHARSCPKLAASHVARTTPHTRISLTASSRDRASQKSCNEHLGPSPKSEIRESTAIPQEGHKNKGKGSPSPTVRVRAEVGGVEGGEREGVGEGSLEIVEIVSGARY